MIPTKKKTPEELAALRDAFAFPESFPEPAAEPQPNPDESADQDLTNRGDDTPASRKKRQHTLRKVELPLFPAQPVTRKTSLPHRRRSLEEIKKIQSREIMVTPENHPNHPILQLKKLTAHPLLLTPTYLIAFTAGLAVWKRAYFITPISLVCVSGLLTVYIFWKKKRSRHHAAILMIILAMTLIFGAILYAPFLKPYLAPYFPYAT